MQPACPICREPMALKEKTDTIFGCTPCRQMIQFFGERGAEVPAARPADAPVAELIRPLPPPLREAMTWPREGLGPLRHQPPTRQRRRA